MQNNLPKYIMDKRLTPVQQEAVRKNDDTIVSAAAGAGKTTTMIERIMRMVLDDGIELKNMLVLVYNNAAADDLRARLHGALYDAMKRAKDDALGRLRVQIDELPLCHISTIHAYCQSLIKEHFDLLGISPTFEVVDEDAHAEYMNKALDLTFEKMAAADKVGDGSDASFFNLNKVFAQGRKDDSFKSIIIKLFQAIDIQSDKEAFKNSVLSAYADFDNSVFLKIILQNEKEIIERGIELLSDSKYKVFIVGKEDKYAKRVEDVINVLKQVESAIKLDGSKTMAECAETIYQIVSTCSITKASKSNCGEEYKYLADEVKPIVDTYIATDGRLARLRTLFADMNALREGNNQNYEFVKKMIEIAEEFGNTLAELKRADNVLAFEDLQHYAVKLFEIAEFEKPKYDAVFVDEYQDVNPTQESIIRSIEAVNPGKCFFVGDVKQSIYGFRLADPRIFLERFDKYDADDQKSAMTFQSNFRSAKNILEYVNRIFNVVMTKDSADVDYLNDGSFDLDTVNFGGIVETNVFYNGDAEPKTAEEKEEKEFGVYDITAAKTKQKDLDAKDFEAMFVANKILQLVNNAKEDGRYISYDDVVILARYWRNFDRVKEYLKKAGIPFEETGVSDDKGNPERELLMFLNSIDNPRQDHAFAGYLLSFFGGYSEQELVTIANVSPAECLYDKFVIFKGKKTNDAEEIRLVEKVKKTLSDLERYQMKASFKSVRELAGGIISDFSYDAYLARKGIAGVDAVKSFIASISDKDNESLGRFLRNQSDVSAKSSQTASSGAMRNSFENAIVALVLALDDVSTNNAIEDLAKSKLFGVDVHDIEDAKKLQGGILFEKLAAYKVDDEERQNRIDAFVKGFLELKQRYSQTKSVLDFIKETIDACKCKFDEKDVLGIKSFVDSIPTGTATAKQFLDWYFVPKGKVHLSTMHGYKGLESKVVFVIRTDESFNSKDYSGSIAIDASGIVAMNNFDFSTYLYSKTLAKQAIEIVIKERMLKEEMRLFYVALTRAKSHLYVSAAISKEAQSKFGKETLDNPKSMIDFVSAALVKNRALGRTFPYFVALNGAGGYVTPLSEIKNLPLYDKLCGGGVARGFVIGAPYEKYKKLIDESQAFVYPHKVDTELSVKYSVSALDAMGEDEDFAPSAYTEEGANIGTIYHKIMQHIDFATEGEEAVLKAVDAMHSSGILSDEEIETLARESKDYAHRIAVCLASDVMQTAKNSKCLREKAFMMYKPANEVRSEFGSTEEVLVQGVIDLLILGEKTIIVDFKYSSLDDEETKNKYKKQLNLYKMAVKSAFGGREVDEIGLYSFIKNDYFPL